MGEFEVGIEFWLISSRLLLKSSRRSMYPGLAGTEEEIRNRWIMVYVGQ